MKPYSLDAASRHDLQTLRNRNRRQGADLLSLRQRDDGAARQAAGRGSALRAAPAVAAAVVVIVDR